MEITAEICVGVVSFPCKLTHEKTWSGMKCSFYSSRLDEIFYPIAAEIFMMHVSFVIMYLSNRKMSLSYVCQRPSYKLPVVRENEPISCRKWIASVFVRRLADHPSCLCTTPTFNRSIINRIIAVSISKLLKYNYL